jgi:flagellar protein FliO/FliZ
LMSQPADAKSNPPQWQQLQSEPSLVRRSGISVPNQNPQQQPAPIVQSDGQRIFNTQTNPPAYATQTPNTSNAPNTSVVPASFNSDIAPSTSLTTSKSNTRQPIELRPSSKAKSGSLEAPKSSWTAAVSMFFSLAIVLSFFFLVAWFVKKSQPSSMLKLPNSVVQVMGRTPMAPRQQMYVVRFGSKLLLVSHQPGQTQTLCEITDADEVQRIAGLCEANQPGSISNSFRDVLRQVTAGKLDPETKPTPRLSRSR